MAGTEKILIPYHEAVDGIRAMIDKGRILRTRSIQFEKELDAAKTDFSKWDRDNEELLLKIFSTDEELKLYKNSFSLVLRHKFYLHEMVKDLRDLIESKIGHLESIVSRLNIVTQIDFDTSHDDIFSSPIIEDKVFVVHGDKNTRKEIVDLLKKHGLEAIVLNDKKTFFDDFANHTDVNYAVIIATNHDVGAAKTVKDKLKPRARQSLILEIGYFIGKFGPDRLSVIANKDLELPSNLIKTSVVRKDSQGWERKLLKALNNVYPGMSSDSI